MSDDKPCCRGCAWYLPSAAALGSQGNCRALPPQMLIVPAAAAVLAPAQAAQPAHQLMAVYPSVHAASVCAFFTAAPEEMQAPRVAIVG